MILASAFATLLGQFILGALLLVVGWALNRRAKATQVNVDGRLLQALTKIDEQNNRIDQLADALRVGGVEVPATTSKTSITAPS